MALTITTLKKRADFLRLNRGQKYITPHLILRALKTAGEGECRVGYTVTTKCGNAVIRNRTKRRLRALMRELLPQMGQSGMDYVLIARADAEISVATADPADLRHHLARAITAIHQKFPQ